MIVLKEHKKWILFLVLMNVLINILLYLDAGFVNVSMLYLNLLYYFSLVLFLVLLAKKDNEIVKEKNYEHLSPVADSIKDYYEQEIAKIKMNFIVTKQQMEEKDDELLAWVHEMKSPLTAMKLLLERLDDNQMKTRLENEWLRLSMLLDQQLHTTRLMTIQQDSHLGKVSLRQVVIEEIKTFRSWCIEKGIGFELDQLEGEVIADKKWLSFILRQFISNAIKYSNPNSVIEIISAFSEEGHMLLKIKDFGKGIAAQDLPRVFKKSYTGQKGRESAIASGMGLYLAKQAADNLGLNLSLHSEVDKGTTAVIQFPLQNDYSTIRM